MSLNDSTIMESQENMQKWIKWEENQKEYRGKNQESNKPKKRNSRMANVLNVNPFYGGKDKITISPLFTFLLRCKHLIEGTRGKQK